MSERIARTLRTYVQPTAIPAEVPSRVLLFPWGEFQTDQGPFIFDEAALAAVQTHFKRIGRDIPFDWEHTTAGGKFARPDRKSPASGWIKALHGEPGVGLWADVEWTPDGRKDLETRSYRYLSPTFYDDDARRIEQLISVALTNDPGTFGIPPIVTSAQRETTTGTEGPKGDQMDKFLKELRGLLGLTDQDDEAKVLTAVKARLGGAKTLRAGVCKALAVEESSDDEAVLRALSSRPAADSVVPREQHELVAGRMKELGEQVTALTAWRNDREIDDRIDAALKAGKLKPADLADEAKRKNLRTLAASPASWNVLVDSLPVQTPEGGAITDDRLKTGPTQGGERAGLITLTARKFDGEPGLARITDKATFVNGELRAKGLPALSEEERKQYAA